MKLVLVLLSLLAFALSSLYEEEYGCSLQKVSKCCWSHYNGCCDPPSGPRSCPEKRTLCCKKKVYDMEEGIDVIEFYPY